MLMIVRVNWDFGVVREDTCYQQEENILAKEVIHKSSRLSRR